MKFFNFSDLAKSWSVWAATAVTVVPVIDEHSMVFNFIPAEYKPYAVTIMGLVVLLARAIKQTNTIFSSK